MSARLALGAVRHSPFASQRVTALHRLRQEVKADVLAVVDELAANGWLDAYSDADLLGQVVAQWHRAVADGAERAIAQLWDTR